MLKSLYGNDNAKSILAAKRFKRLPEFANHSTDEIINSDIKRKHALAVIASEKGFNSWNDLKCQLPFIRGGFLNLWFADYKEAKVKQEADGGYILPYQKQFFICNKEYIRQLGFNPDDPDWNLIDFDWAKPKNLKAWKRLYTKWIAIQEKQDV